MEQSDSGEEGMDKKTENFKKSNILIGAKYRSTLMENKILAVALSKIETARIEKDGSLVSSMSAAELRELFGDSTGSIYRHLKPVAKGMTSRVIGMEDPEKKEFHYMAVVTNADYKDGIFSITFNPLLRDQINNIKNKFTLLSLPTMMSFKSVYSFRLYELLRSETFIGNHNCQYNLDGSFEFLTGLAELKLEIGVIDADNDKVKRVLSAGPDYDKAIEAAPEKRFTEWYDFKRRVLDTARDEINRKTDMILDYLPKREGRGGKIRSVLFKVQYKKTDTSRMGASDPGAEHRLGSDTSRMGSEQPDTLRIEPDKKTEQPDTSRMGAPDSSEKMYCIEPDTSWMEASDPGERTHRLGSDKKTDIIDLIDQTMLIISEKITARDAEAILKAADYDINRIKDAYEIASDNVDNIVGWMISAVREGYRKPVKKKKNTGYDIEEIERTLVANRLK